jgi:hypothetical protein
MIQRRLNVWEWNMEIAWYNAVQNYGPFTIDWCSVPQHVYKFIVIIVGKTTLFETLSSLVDSARLCLVSISFFFSKNKVVSLASNRQPGGLSPHVYVPQFPPGTGFFSAGLRWRYSIGRTRDNAVGIATGYGLHDRGVGVRVPVVSPPIQWVRRVPSSGVKQPGSEADRSHPATTNVKKTWIYTSTTPYAFIE